MGKNWVIVKLTLGRKRETKRTALQRPNQIEYLERVNIDNIVRRRWLGQDWPPE